MGNTQFCAHTGDGSVCDACLGRTQPPATGLVKFVPRILSNDGMVTEAEIAHYKLPLATYYLAADVEASCRSMRLFLEEFLTSDNSNWKRLIPDAQRLLAQLRGLRAVEMAKDIMRRAKEGKV